MCVPLQWPVDWVPCRVCEVIRGFNVDRVEVWRTLQQIAQCMHAFLFTGKLVFIIVTKSTRGKKRLRRKWRKGSTVAIGGCSLPSSQTAGPTCRRAAPGRLDRTRRLTPHLTYICARLHHHGAWLALRECHRRPLQVIQSTVFSQEMDSGSGTRTTRRRITGRDHSQKSDNRVCDPSVHSCSVVRMRRPQCITQCKAPPRCTRIQIPSRSRGTHHEWYAIQVPQICRRSRRMSSLRGATIARPRRSPKPPKTSSRCCAQHTYRARYRHSRGICFRPTRTSRRRRP